MADLPKAKMIEAALRGLSKPHEEMEQLLAQAPTAVREQIQAEIDTINTWHPAVLYWMEHGVWEAVVEYYSTHRHDEAEAA